MLKFSFSSGNDGIKPEELIEGAIETNKRGNSDAFHRLIRCSFNLDENTDLRNFFWENKDNKIKCEIFEEESEDIIDSIECNVVLIADDIVNNRTRVNLKEID